MAQALKYPTSQNFVQKTLGAALLSGVTAAATLNNITGIQNKRGVFIVDRIDANGVETPSRREVVAFTATSGLTVTTLTRNADSSGTDQDHAVGAIVEFGPDVLWAQSVIDGLSEVLDPATGLVDATKVLTPTSTSTVTNKIYNGGTGASLTLISPSVVGGVFASLPVFSGQPRLMGGSLTPFVSLTDSSIMYMDFSASNKWLATIVPSGARTFLATNATLGSIGMLRVTYASTASLALGLLNSAASISLVNWSGGTRPTPTATVGKSDLFGFVCVSTTPGFDAITISQNL